MKFSEQWLREWVNPDVSTVELANQLSLLGLEVDAVAPVAGEFSQVVVGEIEQAEAHPDADKLQVCQVNVGAAQPLQIVCGAKNARAGLRVAVAQVGAVLPGDFKIKSAKLRGVQSSGMLCAAAELGLATTSEGIMELPADAPIATDLRSYMQLADNSIDIELTPDRGDCLSVRGIARDVAAKYNLPLQNLEIPEPSWQDNLPQRAVHVQDFADCSAYYAVNLQLPVAVSERQTPLWVQERLRRSGLRPVNPVVDAGNYVMLELGQPLHAFDADKLQGDITVKRAKAGSKVLLLDDNEVTLLDGTLLVCDAVGVQAIAGVMGAKSSAVSSDTCNLFIESACFSAVTLGRFSRPLGIKSDAQHRFERNVDPCLQLQALSRMVNLLLDWYGGTVGALVQPAQQPAWQATSVHLSAAQVERYLGVHIEPEQIEQFLLRLGFAVSSVDAGWQVQVPSFRADVALPADLIEEIARLYGYDNIPAAVEYLPVTARAPATDKLPMSSLRLSMQGLGYMDCIHYSFVSEKSLQPFLDKQQPIALQHPLSTDMAVMRTTLWAGLLQTAAFNFNRQAKQLRLYELGNCFIPESGKVREQTNLAMLLAGEHVPQQWGQETRRVDFYDLKGDVQQWFATHGLSITLKTEKHMALHPGRSARVYLGEKAIGWLGEVHPQVLKQFSLEQPVYLCELQLAACLEVLRPSFQPISSFPAVRRDLAFLVDAELETAALTDWVKQHCGELLVDQVIFDVYAGEHTIKGKKSMGLGLTFQAVSRTLVDEEVNQLIQGVVEGVQRKFKAELRA